MTVSTVKRTQVVQRRQIQVLLRQQAHPVDYLDVKSKSPKAVSVLNVGQSTTAARNTRGVIGLRISQLVVPPRNNRNKQFQARMRFKTLWLGVGLGPKKQREWLVDCYRMRLDDDYAVGGDVRGGSLYDQSEPDEIIQDFLVFCRLAERGFLLFQK